MLATLYPSYNWEPWRFYKCPKKYWDDVNNRRKYVDWVGKQLIVKDLSDWYHVTVKVNKVTEKLCLCFKDFFEKGGAGLLASRYNNSLSSMLASVYPEYDWLPWRFERAPKGVWEEPGSVKKFMDWAANELNIKDDEWHQIPTKVIKLKIYSLQPRNYSIWEVLSSKIVHSLMPYCKVVTLMLNLVPKSHKQYLKQCYKLCFEKVVNSGNKRLICSLEVFEEYKHPDLLSDGGPLELDFFYPQLKLAVEYQVV
jgi:hypothetical protein